MDYLENLCPNPGTNQLIQFEMCYWATHTLSRGTARVTSKDVFTGILLEFWKSQNATWSVPAAQGSSPLGSSFPSPAPFFPSSLYHPADRIINCILSHTNYLTPKLCRPVSLRSWGAVFEKWQRNNKWWENGIGQQQKLSPWRITFH